MADLTVKYFNSGMTGAPQIANNWGDLVTMLDACLVNGFALKAIDTLTFADGIATATISSGHAYRPFQVVEIAGAEQPEYNGSFRVLTTTTTAFTYAVTGTPVSPATTTTNLSAKVAPLGWEKPFAGTSKAAYRSKNPQSPQNILLIGTASRRPTTRRGGPSGPTSASSKTCRTSTPSLARRLLTTRTTRRRTGSRSPPVSGVGTSGSTHVAPSTRAMATAVAAAVTGC